MRRFSKLCNLLGFAFSAFFTKESSSHEEQARSFVSPAKDFLPLGFADAVLGTAYFLLLFLLFSENFFEFHEKVDIHCIARRFFQKIVEITEACPQYIVVEFNACPGGSV